MHHHTRETSQRKGITVPEIRVENDSTRRQALQEKFCEKKKKKHPQTHPGATFYLHNLLFVNLFLVIDTTELILT
jgi:hypothetical protein